MWAFWRLKHLCGSYSLYYKPLCTILLWFCLIIFSFSTIAKKKKKKRKIRLTGLWPAAYENNHYTWRSMGMHTCQHLPIHTAKISRMTFCFVLFLSSHTLHSLSHSHMHEQPCWFWSVRSAGTCSL